MEYNKLSYIFRQYSCSYIVKLVYWAMRSKLISINARLIRFPFDIRGKQYIDLGNRLTTGVGCRLEAYAKSGDNTTKIIFGNNVQINDYVHIVAMKQVFLGDNVLIASHVYISDNSHGCYKGCSDDTPPVTPPMKRPYFISPIKIGSNVWIGEGVIIMPGVTIGDGVVIGAHSIVNSDIPANCIAVGAPARIIKKYDFSKETWCRTDVVGNFLDK